MPGDEGGGLPHAAGGHDSLLGVCAGHRAGTRGHQQALRVVFATAAAKAVAAGVAEAPSLDAAHQTLGHHVVEALPVLLGNEDPGEHSGHGH